MKDQHHQGPQAQAHDWRWTIPNLLVYMETLTKLWLCRAKGSEHVVLFWLVMSPWSVKNVDLLERLQRWALGMVTNMRGRTSAARPVETRMINLSVRVKWGIRRFMTGKYQADRDREPLYTDVNSSLWMNNMTSWTLSWPSKNVLKTWRLGALG